MEETRELKVTGGALAKPRKTRRHKGGNPSLQESAASAQQAAQSVGPTQIQQFGGKKQTGGNSTGAIVNLSSTRAPVAPGSSPQPLVSGVPLNQPAPVQGGGVVLAPKRKNRISLRAKKGGSTSLTDLPPPVGGTRKVRKIHIRVKGVTARVAKAKKVKNEAMTAPMQQVRTKLEAAGVIKKTSKAPEKMLRTMYADLLITKKGL
jgi:hypothetical protein